MYTMDVSFEVFKELTYRRRDENHTIDDVLREMLKLDKATPAAAEGGRAWVSEGVVFPHGTQFRGTRKGQTHTAVIKDGQLFAGGKACAGLSPAVKAATGRGENGWKFWSVKRPADADYRLVDQLRKKH